MVVNVIEVVPDADARSIARSDILISLLVILGHMQGSSIC